MTRKTDLTMLRRRLREAIAVAEPREVPALSRELRAVTAELLEFEKPKGANPLDELAARRAAGGADAPSASQAGGGTKRRR